MNPAKPNQDSMRRSFFALHRDRRATALTEFVITLPVYMVMLMGIMTLYELHQGVMTSERAASGNAWEDTVNLQTNGMFNWDSAQRVTPPTGLGSVYSFYNDYEWSAYAGADALTTGGGLYLDSGLKGDVIGNVADFNVSGVTSPVTGATDVMCNPSHTRNLMDDVGNFSSGTGGSLAGTINSALNYSGVRPGVAAGIRYGITGGSDDLTFGTGGFRGYEAEANTGYMVSSPTQPTERFPSVAFSYLEIYGNDAFNDLAPLGWNNWNSGDTSSCPPPE